MILILSLLLMLPASASSIYNGRTNRYGLNTSTTLNRRGDFTSRKAGRSRLDMSGRLYRNTSGGFEGSVYDFNKRRFVNVEVDNRGDVRTWDWRE